jgi:glutamine synthetase
MDLIRELIKESKAVRFEGNNYSSEWAQEAKKRGLPILNQTVDAVDVLHDSKAVEFLVRHKVLNADEIASRYHVAVERYNKVVEIELHTLAELVNQFVVPAVEAQLHHSHQAHEAIAGSAMALHQSRVKKLSEVLGDVLGGLQTLHDKLEHALKYTDEAKRMKHLASEAIPAAQKVRAAADAAELLVGDKFWPLPKYREMLFSNYLS